MGKLRLCRVVVMISLNLSNIAVRCYPYTSFHLRRLRLMPSPINKLDSDRYQIQIQVYLAARPRRDYCSS